jgi:hypothetical protein
MKLGGLLDIYSLEPLAIYLIIRCAKMGSKAIKPACLNTADLLTHGERSESSCRLEDRLVLRYLAEFFFLLQKQSIRSNTKQASNEETHNAEDEPGSDTDEIRADLNCRINQYFQSTEKWTERHWLRHQEETRYPWYHHYWRAMHHNRRRCPHIIPFDENDYSDVRYVWPCPVSDLPLDSSTPPESLPN